MDSLFAVSMVQRAGYVKKIRSKKDQRVVKTQIQPKGRDRLNKSVPIIFGHARDLLKARFSKKEVLQLDRLMKALRDVSLRELGSEAKRSPATIEWEPEPMDQWRAIVKKYRAGDTGFVRLQHCRNPSEHRPSLHRG